MLPELRELFGIFKNNSKDRLWETAMLKCYEHTEVKKDNFSVHLRHSPNQFSNTSRAQSLCSGLTLKRKACTSNMCKYYHIRVKHICRTESLGCTAKINIVNQLYLNKIIFF